MIHLMSFIEAILLLMSIVLFLKWIFRRESFYIIMSVSALSMYFGVKGLLNDQLVVGGMLFIVAILLGMLCEYEVKKE
ncbi:hypothetical protein QRD86_00185 (plasmid) [Bacillus halotolerans]|uniref:hypothetical protein n=1 Tax=Bacillus halotolerans TaxID=260554 RepID=UPI00256FFDE7|nr:hypothetical protein [Bacillus halotolerans]WJE41206.1 hypothetical protein QRD86_00185 [Bacillus halotolerans]